MDFLNALVKANEARKEPGDYIQDGLLYCGHCETPKQCRVSFGAEDRIVGCQCACASRRYEAECQAAKDRELRLRIEQMRSDGVRDRLVSACRFETAQETPELKKCRRYVEQWPEMLRANSGLLFWGNTGNGKTYAAACIANALIDRGIPAMVTSFPSILASDWETRAEITAQLNCYKLLVLDDLGAERGSDYALETVYRVVDERYKSRLPLIVTTNLTLEDLCKPKNMDYQRIYDRVLEMCVPVVFEGSSIRRQRANDNLRRAREVLGVHDDI